MKKREGGSGRGDVGREAQANVGLRFIYVFRKRVIIGGLRSSKMVSWKNLQEAETKIYNKTKTQKRKQKQKENRKQKQKKRNINRKGKLKPKRVCHYKFVS